jgi:hypothetical protein
MLDLKKIDRWIAETETSRGMQFGYCERCHALTPAIISAGPEGVYAECGECGCSNQERFPARGYAIGGDIPRKEETQLQKLSEPQKQREYLVGLLQAAIDKADERKQQLVEQQRQLSRETVAIAGRLAQLQ